MCFDRPDQRGNAKQLRTDVEISKERRLTP